MPLIARRALFAAVMTLVAAALVALAALSLAPGGWSAWKLAALLSFAGTAPWTGICAANALLGAAVRLGAADPVRAVFPPLQAAVPPIPPVAIALAVRNERMETVLPPLDRLLAGLDHTDVGAAFTAFVLSDSEEIAEAGERAAVARLAPTCAPGRLHYRRRADNRGFKVGNIQDFVDRYGSRFELMLVLDADSEMTAAAVLRMLGAMQADPSLAIVQHLTVGRPAEAAFARLFQFGMRAGMRIWATGQAWWQDAAGPYWGHNALIRLAPFRLHARLPELRAGQPILSHDQVEAALLAAAGWGVRVLPVEDGSTESNPPALPEFIHRDRRWLAGNLQYVRLLRDPGFSWMGRWQLAQAILMFAGAPLYLACAVCCAIGAAVSPDAPVPRAGALATLLLWAICLYSPKLAGYAEVLAGPGARGRYGGGRRFAAGVAAELLFTALLDPLMQVAKTVGMLRAMCGRPGGWAPQNRCGRHIGRRRSHAAPLAPFASRRAARRRLCSGWAGTPALGRAAARRTAARHPILRSHRQSALRRLAAATWDLRDPRGGRQPASAGRRVGTAGGRGCASGSQTLYVVPFPSSLSMTSWPRCRLTMCLTIASPRPVPPSLRERPVSTR
jgi:membrane glycosyltransferase